MTTDMENIKQSIWTAVEQMKKARLQVGWSIAQLSKLSGVSVGVISDLENNKGKVPSLANFIALTRTLCMSRDFVLKVIMDTSLCDTSDDSNSNKTVLSLIDVLKEYGIYDTESLDFIVNTVNFVKTRKKNNALPDIDNDPSILKKEFPGLK